MKKLTLALLALPVLLTGTAVIAGMQQHDGGFNKCDQGEKMQKGDRTDRENNRLEKMSKQLGLSDSQQEEMHKLFNSKQEQRQEMHAQMRNLHQATRTLDPSAADYKERLAETKAAAADMAVSRVDQHVGMQTEMAKILTADQLSKLEKMRDGFGEERNKHRGEGDGKRPQPQE